MTTPNLATALITAKRNFKPIAKTKTNPHFKSKYASLDNILEAIEEALADNGLLLLQPTELIDNVPVIKTILIHAPTGNQIESVLSLPALSDPQKLGSVLTYYRRYGICNLLAISPDEDDDGRGAASNSPSKSRATNGERSRSEIIEDLMGSLSLSQNDLRQIIKDNYDCKVSEMSREQFTTLVEMMKNFNTVLIGK